jgi:predicted small lipoprotein YifL
MKNYLLYCLLSVILISCGQIGPLYLPDAPPPIHVAPEAKPAKAETKTNTTNAPSKTEPTK